MLNKTAAIETLRKAFTRRPVAELTDLLRLLETRSRMSVFRRLRDVGYLTSFTHGGRYYTLADIPQFDDNGLWFWQEVGFSAAGTLKETTVQDVQASDAGRTHHELKRLLRVRVHNALLGLVREGRIGRESLGRLHLYVSADTDRAAEQLVRRGKLMETAALDVVPLSSELTVEVLVEIVHVSEVHVDPPLVAKRLVARGIPVSVAQVEEVSRQYGLDDEKKTVDPSSPPLPD